MTANAQTPNPKGGGAIWIAILALLSLVLWYFFKKKLKGKTETQSSDTQIQVSEIYQGKGFSNTELIVTHGSISPTGDFGSMGLDDPTYNILIGVKNGILSFFGGEQLGEFIVKNNACTFQKKPASETFLFKKPKKFSHLFDIPISDIAEIVPRQKGKNVVILNIYEKSDNRTRLCFHYAGLNELNIALANILMDAFGRILETESISKGIITQINEDIEDALKEGNALFKKKVFKGISTVVLVGAIIGVGAVGAANRMGDRQSFRDHFGA